MKANASGLLNEGIAAAKAGQREHARDLLVRVVEQDEKNALAWLWLSGVVDSLDDRAICLENVLALDPDNVLARKGFDAVCQQRADQLLHEGIAAAQSEQRERARELLTQAVELNEGNVAAWLWLSDVVDTPHEREVCLENVLALDPYNDTASRGLALLHREKEAAAFPSSSMAESAMMARVQPPATPAAAILQADFARQIPQPKPASPLLQSKDEFDDEYLCPYCAALTQPNDLTCESCGEDLWARFRVREERSAWLWSTLTLPISGMLQSGVGLVVLLLYAYLAHRLPESPTEDLYGYIQVFLQAALRVKSEPFDLLPVYFGLQSNLSPRVVNAALGALPRPVFFLFTLPFLFSLIILVGLYNRWKPILYLYLVSAALGMVIAVVGIFLSSGNVFFQASLSLVALVAALMLLMGFKIREDFKWKKERILLRVDPGLSSATDFAARGNLYTHHKMWAMAAIHLRRAAGLMPRDVDSRLALVAAYLRLQRYDRATELLERINQIIPDDPRVDKLRAFLDDVRASDA